MHLRIHAALSPQCNAVHLNLVLYCHRSVNICSRCNLHTSSSTCRKQIHLKAKMFKCLKFRVGLRQIRGKLDHNFLSSWSLVVGLIAPIVTNKGEKKEKKREKAEFMLFIVVVFLRQLRRSVGNGAHYLKWRHRHPSPHLLQVNSSQTKNPAKILINN